MSGIFDQKNIFFIEGEDHKSISIKKKDDIMVLELGKNYDCRSNIRIKFTYDSMYFNQIKNFIHLNRNYLFDLVEKQEFKKIHEFIDFFVKK